MIDEVQIFEAMSNKSLCEKINEFVINIPRKREIKNISYAIGHYGLTNLYQALVMIGPQ